MHNSAGAPKWRCSSRAAIWKSSLAIPRSISLYDMPAVYDPRAVESKRMERQSVEFTRTDLNVQALGAGNDSDRQFAGDGSRAGKSKGRQARFLMENNGGEFLMVGKNEIKGLQGHRRQKICHPWRSRDHVSRGQTLAAQRLQGQAKYHGYSRRREPHHRACRTIRSTPPWSSLATGSISTAKAPGRYHIIKTGNLFNISGASFWANVGLAAQKRRGRDGLYRRIAQKLSHGSCQS